MKSLVLFVVGLALGVLLTIPACSIYWKEQNQPAQKEPLKHGRCESSTTLGFLVNEKHYTMKASCYSSAKPIDDPKQPYFVVQSWHLEPCDKKLLSMIEIRIDDNVVHFQPSPLGYYFYRLIEGGSEYYQTHHQIQVLVDGKVVSEGPVGVVAIKKG